MEMNNILSTVIFIFGCIGMTQIVVESSIANKFKNLVKTYTPKTLQTISNFFLELTGCYQCTGFWTGIFISCLYVLPCVETYWDYAKIFVGGCASSCISYFWATFLTYLESQTVIRP
jgi:hypothetical protein